jgi:hypothetical protein
MIPQLSEDTRPVGGQPLVQKVASFLVRLWHLESGGRRIEIEHITSGDRTIATSLADAWEWMDLRSNAASIESPTIGESISTPNGPETPELTLPATPPTMPGLPE